MFGRQSNHNELIRHLFRGHANLQTFDEIESHTFNESIDTHTFNENYPYQDDVDNDSNPSEYIPNVTEIICSNANNHENIRLYAKENITTEQLSYKAQYDSNVSKNRPSIREGDKFMYLNMPKLKSMKNAKYQDKWIGPFIASKVTYSHVTISKDELNCKQDKKVPIDHIQLYIERDSTYQQKRHRGDSDYTASSSASTFNLSSTSSQNSSLFLASKIPSIDNSSPFFSKEIISTTRLNPNSIHNPRTPEIPNTPLTHLNVQESSNYGFSEEQIKFLIDSFKSTLQLGDIDSVKGFSEHDKKMSEFWLHFINENITKDKMNKIIRDNLMNISAGMYPNYGTRKLAKTTTEILYYKFMEYLDDNLWDKVELTNAQNLNSNVSPKISCIESKWQTSKCNALGINLISINIQPINFEDYELSGLIPWESQNIIGDGNCLFRALSWIICGDECKHEIIRMKITKFIASHGAKTIEWLLNQLGSELNTPKKYLQKKMMHSNGVWGSDIEKFAASYILATDIYLATHDGEFISWKKFSFNNNYTKNYIYLVNYRNDHYEPVISFRNCYYSSYGRQEIVQEIIE